MDKYIHYTICKFVIFNRIKFRKKDKKYYIVWYFKEAFKMHFKIIIFIIIFVFCCIEIRLVFQVSTT